MKITGIYQSSLIISIALFSIISCNSPQKKMVVPNPCDCKSIWYLKSNVQVSVNGSTPSRQAKLTEVEKEKWKNCRNYYRNYDDAKDECNKIRGYSEPGDEWCRSAVSDRISEIGGVHTGIEYKGNGKFIAFVSSPTTNYNYQVVIFTTNEDCEITNVKVN